MGRSGGEERGRLVPLSAAEAEGISHELTEDAAARFFRLEGPPLTPAEAGPGPAPRQGDTLVVLEGARPNEGDLMVVRLEGNGYLLGRSRKRGTWCLLAGGAAVPLEGGEVHPIGVVMGVLRKVVTRGAG